MWCLELRFKVAVGVVVGVEVEMLVGVLVEVDFRH